MKKNIFNIISILVIALVLFSCKKYEPEEIYYDSVLLDLSKNTMTFLDKTLTTTIDFVSKTKNVSSVDLLVGGKKITTASVSGNKVTVTLNRSELGLKEIGDKVKLNVNATVDGKVKEMYTVLKMVGSAVEIKPPQKEVKDENGKVEMVFDPVYELSNVVKNITYKVNSNTNVNVTLERKINKSGTFSNVFTKKYNKDDFKVAIKGSEFNVSDTVFFRLVAKTDFASDTAETIIVINPYDLPGKDLPGKIDIKNLGFDLLSDTLCSVASDSCKIQFTHDFTQLYQGFNTLHSTSFVKIPEGDDLIKSSNLPILKTAFDVGSQLTSINNVKVEDMFIVKIVKGTDVFYGKLVVEEINTNRKADDDFLSFKYDIVKYDTEQ